MGLDESVAVSPIMDNVSKALALARLGIKVFPVRRSNGAPAIPEDKGGRGFYDGTIDAEQIATWFLGDFESSTKYAVGYWAGGSGLYVCDIDQKNGKDGFARIAERELSLGDTYAYPTKSNGQHRVFQTDRDDLTLSQDHAGLVGVDVRAGGSYAVWWADEVPDSRDVFSTDIPEWMTEASTKNAEFTGEGFSGSVTDWLDAIPDASLPSQKVVDFMGRIPTGEFGHPEMVNLAWGIVRMGSERETGIRMALDKLREAWLRKPFDTPDYRRDFDKALKGAINKAGRVQQAAPTITSRSAALNKAKSAGIYEELSAVERAVSETVNEVDYARARRELFKIAAAGGLAPETALGIVTGSKAFRNSKVSVESTWFSDGEPQYHEAEIDEGEFSDEAQAEAAQAEEEMVRRVANLSADAASFSFLDPTEQAQAAAYEWFGKEYLEFVQARLEHFNKPYHVAAMWAGLSVIASPWGKVKAQGGSPVDCNLYHFALGVSTSGKSESVGFLLSLVDAVYGTENSPLIGEISKLSALALHRALILRDGKPSMIIGDEIQSFFRGVGNTQWQNGILGDVSSHYGGNVMPKLTLNDKEISGKRAKTLFTSYLTGISDQTLDALSINHWTDGSLFRYLWSFGEPRKPKSHKINFAPPSVVDYKKQFEVWGNEFKRRGAQQEMKWGTGREVDWEEDAKLRMEQFSEQIENAVQDSSLYDDVFVTANVRFFTSIMKCATLVALSEASEKVTLDHVLVAIDYAGAWHRSMVLAVSETGKEPFDREVEKCLRWIRKNAIKQVGERPWIQRSAVMREFKPNEVADRLLRQLTEEGWLVKSGDKYEVSVPEGRKP